MREYGRVFSAFWQSVRMRELTEDGRSLALYLLTSPHANLIGCYRLPEAYAADDLQWESGRVSEGLAELSAKGFLTFDRATKWVLIHTYMEWNAFENGNVAKAARKAFDLVPAIALKPLLAKAFLQFGQHLDEGFREALATLVEPFANPEPEPEPLQNLNRSQNPAQPEPGCAGPAAAEPTPTAKAKAAPKPSEASQSAASKAWALYSAAYVRRHGAEPVRNAKTNGQFGQLVARLGTEEAGLVAAFFVGHDNAYYVRCMHDVNALLRDAEKLRTEWATNRKVTSTQAQQVDRTATNRNAFQGLIDQAEREAADGQR